jgi:maltose alpha-D-glucosyltransferase/alpha-amylase
MLGRRTAELHLALAGCDDNPAFAPEPITVDYVEGLQQKIAAQSERTFEVLRRNLSRLTDEASGLGMQLLQFADDLPEGISALTVPANAGLRTRIHGDYHLGQVLVTDEDFVILDFEGEPARSLADRRAKHSPLKDVAGMLRSFSYAASASLSKEADHASADLVSWAELWEQAVSTEFLQVYWQVMQSSSILPPQFASLQTLLNVYLLEKAFYELLYELNNRPAWVQIPLMSILSLLPTLEPARGRKLRPTG